VLLTRTEWRLRKTSGRDFEEKVFQKFEAREEKARRKKRTELLIYLDQRNSLLGDSEENLTDLGMMRWRAREDVYVVKVLELLKKATAAPRSASKNSMRSKSMERERSFFGGPLSF
jgi:hypothetical protein